MTPAWIPVLSWRRLLATCPCPFLDPFPPVGSGAQWPLTTQYPSSTALAYPCLPALISFPLVRCANEPLDCPCFIALCWVHTDEGNSPRHWPGTPTNTQYWRWRNHL